VATHGENGGHQRGDSVAAYGELSMATVMAAVAAEQARFRREVRRRRRESLARPCAMCV
jgi:hypothetical protein